MKYLVGDSVVVRSGDDKGKTGIILKIFAKKNTVLVDGINLHTCHIKKRENDAGGRIQKSLPIDISNIALFDPKTKKPTRIHYKIKKTGEKVRVAKSGEELPLPQKKKTVKK